MKILDEAEASRLWENLRDKDNFTAEHCRRVQEIASMFAHSLGWSEEDIKWLKVGALLHDIGKMEVPDYIFEKIRKGESLTSDEKKKIREHAGHTRNIEEYSNVSPIVRNILKYHHERYNGSGYPDGLAGEEIPMEVRILSISDYYDSIITQRSHRIPDTMKPLNKLDGIKILIDEASLRFAPDIVEKFIKNVILGNESEINIQNTKKEISV